MRAWFAVGLGLSLYLISQSSATDALAGVIRGELRLPARAKAPTPRPNPYPGRADALPRSARDNSPTPGDAVVYVEDLLPETAPPGPKRRVELGQKDQAFLPRVLAVQAGTTVEFPNYDPIYHNVFSVSPVKRFDLGKYPRGQSRRVTFNKPGLVNVFCEIHSDMAAYVFVLPHKAFVQPDKDGMFELPDLPPGIYTVKVWHPDYGDLSRRVEVPAEGDVRLELEY